MLSTFSVTVIAVCSLLAIIAIALALMVIGAFVFSTGTAREAMRALAEDPNIRLDTFLDEKSTLIFEWWK